MILSKVRDVLIILAVGGYLFGGYRFGGVSRIVCEDSYYRNTDLCLCVASRISATSNLPRKTTKEISSEAVRWCNGGGLRF